MRPEFRISFESIAASLPGFSESRRCATQRDPARQRPKNQPGEAAADAPFQILGSVDSLSEPPVRAVLGFGQAYAGAWALLALPLVIVAETRLVFLYLCFQFGEGFFTRGADVRSDSRSVHRAGGQR
jgi:hypothetical protein